MLAWMKTWLFGLLAVSPAAAADLLIEAESFTDRGGWKLDTQFIREMGSPYLLAHGLGRPVADAATTAELPAGTYRVFARTKDWVARWEAPGSPGRFALLIDGEEQAEFGTEGAEWHWQAGGAFEHGGGELSLALRDKTGFDGRCDAVYLTTGDAPPEDGEILSDWRRRKLGLPESPEVKDGYDLVVVGGGYAGMASAISASRMGCRVALIQDRGVLGGNGSSEVRVWSMGLIRRGKFPRLGEIVQEFADSATKSPGTKEEFGDDLKERVVRAEPNIDLFLNTHVHDVEVSRGRIAAVTGLDTRTSRETTFRGKLFADCTGHGTVGALAGADWEMTPEGRMGMSNMWAWSERDDPQSFPETPWVLPLTMKDFPYPRDHHGQWFWESGFDKDPLQDAEGIRDWNLRAVYGAFNAMKNRDGAGSHKTARLDWVAFIGGPRESRRLMGDVVLTQDDIVGKQEFPDGCVPSTWSIDLHYPKKQYAAKFAENPFISVAVHDRRIDRAYGYPVPYRCFYSRSIPNLFMAGRNVSVTHEALGTVRVMRTCGMMGEVVGRAAALAVKHGTTPRGVYENHLDELFDLLRLPGKARRETVGGETVIPDDALPPAGPNGPPTGVDPATIAGVVMDDSQAAASDGWTEGSGLKPYIGYGYRYAGAGGNKWLRFTLRPPKAGVYDVRLAYQPHENRSAAVPVEVEVGTRNEAATIDMTAKPDGPHGTVPLGTFAVGEAEEVIVTVRSAKKGNATADAAMLLPAGEQRTSVP